MRFAVSSAVSVFCVNPDADFLAREMEDSSPWSLDRTKHQGPSFVVPRHGRIDAARRHSIELAFAKLAQLHGIAPIAEVGSEQ